MLNIFMEPLPAFNYAQQETNADLLRSVYHNQLRMRLTGTVTIAGGAASGELVPLAPASLIESIRIVWDGRDLVSNLRGEDLFRLTRRCVSQAPEFVAPANADAAATDFAVEFILPFARPWLANPYDTVLPPLPVSQQFKLFVRWNSERTNAGSDPGSAGIVTGGDRTVTLDDVSLTVIQEYSEKPFAPWYIPVISVQSSDAFAVATNVLPLRILGANRFDSVMLISELSDGTPEELVNTVSFLAGNRRFFNSVPRAFLEDRERGLFPGIPNDPTDEPGTLFLPFADGGKLTNVINPAQLRNLGSDPRFEFSTLAPSAGSGLIRAVTFELMTYNGITKIQDNG